MTGIQEKLRAVFQSEAQEHLARIRSILAKEGAATAGANLDEVFRRAHSLKGASRAVDLRAVETLAHALETLFARVRETVVKLDAAVLSVIHQALDGIEEGVATLHSGQSAPDSLRGREAIEKLLASPPDPRKTSDPPVLVASPAPAEPVHDADSNAAVMQSAAETVRISHAIVERLHRSTGQLMTESLRQNIVIEQQENIGRQISEISREWELVRKSSIGPLRRLDVYPELARLAHYVDFVDHRVAALAKDSRALSLLQKRSAWSLKNIGEQLQQDVCGARMVQAGQVFAGFGKMMRDLARDERKEIEFRASGLDVEADRLVLQALKDPIMHLLRNTLAHGIELPDERKKSGKNPVGSVTLRLETQGNKLRVVVEDDGRGVNLPRVTEVAIAKGLLTASAAAALSPEERMRLIFNPGISSARTVTELAGRGMGLNVVSDAVMRLQGTVQAQPATPTGTRFSLSVPLSVSSHRLLLMTCRDQTFAIASHSIEKLIRVKSEDILSVEGKPAINFQGKMLALTSLAHVLKLGDSGIFSQGKFVPVAILKSGEMRIALAVDALLSEIEGVIKDPGPIVMKTGKISGGILMGDGSVVLVLNAAELIEAYQRLDKMPLLKTSQPAPEKIPPTILVVDDSITTRTLEKSILEAHGYRVLLAMDGVEALSQLRAEAIDLIVCDVEMPRLDGFGVLREIKKDPKLREIPIIMVTSLEKREDKERGLELGANGYIVKRKFDQKDLLDTVRQML